MITEHLVPSVKKTFNVEEIIDEPVKVKDEPKPVKETKTKPITASPKRLNKYPLSNAYFYSFLATLILRLVSYQAYNEPSLDSDIRDKLNIPVKEELFAMESGTIAGIFLGVILMAQLGRKTVMFLISISFICVAFVKFIVAIFELKQSIITIVACLMGLPHGMTQVVIPHYASEISPTCFRPAMAAYMVICEAVGSLSMSILGQIPEVYTVAFSVSVAILSSLFILLHVEKVIVESPRWLSCTKQETKAKEAFFALYGEGEITPPDTFPYPVVPDVSTNILVLMTVCLCALSITGAAFIYTYTKFVMIENKDYFGILMKIIFAITFGWLTGPVIRHKVLVVWSTAFIMMNFTIVFMIRNPKSTTNDQNILFVLCSTLISGTTAAAFRETQLLKMTVIYPMHNKGLICALPFVMESATSMICMYTLSSDSSNLTLWSANFVVFICCCVSLYYCIPETQNKSLEQIHQDLGLLSRPLKIILYPFLHLRK